MTDHNLFYYPYASFTNSQLPLLKVAALYFDQPVILDPFGANLASIGADHYAKEAVKQLQDAGILQTVTPADVLAKYGHGPCTTLHSGHLASRFLSAVMTVKATLLRGCLKTCHTSQTAHHQMDHGHADHGFARLGQVFVIFG